jgi:predicted phage terminase large subunit-like protein
LSYATRIVQSRDIAMQTSEKNDYSVCTTWRVDKSDAYLPDLFRGRLEYPDLRRKVIALAQLHRPATILIEDAGPGMSMLQDLGNSIPVGLRPIGVRPVGDKVDRMAAQSAKFEAGQVHLAKDADWHADFLGEMLAFPNGRHDNQVDSVSQLLAWRQNVWMQMQAPIGHHSSTGEGGSS